MKSGDHTKVLTKKKTSKSNKWQQWRNDKKKNHSSSEQQQPHQQQRNTIKSERKYTKKIEMCINVYEIDKKSYSSR